MPKELYLLDWTYAKIKILLLVNMINKIYHAFNICFPLNNSLQNLKSITLKSVEIPVVLNNIRPLNGSFTISFTFTYSTYTNITIKLSVATAAYTGVNTILASINNAVGNAIISYGSLTVKFTLSTGVACFQVYQILANATNFVLN